MGEGRQQGPDSQDSTEEQEVVDPGRADIGLGGSIGPYRLEREIGRGGMAVVYLGSRADEEFERRVAIKILRGEKRSERLLGRFRSERQILANLDHPNIARLYEGGTTADGEPYLVMEYVEGGRPIDRYCDEEKLTVRRRLELFLKVCSAVHYAHQNLVVHRDIKPSNVLIGTDGEPRLLDFGIAKLLDPATSGIAVQATVTGENPMTPQYASPEQVLGRPVTTASDVYSLGALLYKLLTGRLPHDFEGASPMDIARILTGVEPPAPSTRMNADHRRRSLGDLDLIVLMALRHEPQRRYGSAEQLREDLQRYLNGEAVMARGDTLSYRMRVFLRRNWLAVAVGLVIVALVVGFAATFAWQAAETARQRDRAELERDKARQVSDFLVDLFREVDPSQATSRDLTVREALDRGARRIEQELESQPEVKATLLDAIGTVYYQLGLYEEAAPFLEEALDLRMGLGPEDLAVAESLVHLATLRRQVEVASAEELYQRALGIYEARLGADDPEVASVLRELCVLYRRRGRYDEAETAGRRALAILESAEGVEPRRLAMVLASLAGVQSRRGNFAEAEKLLERSLSYYRTSGKTDTFLATAQTNLASVRALQGNFQGALPLLERSLAIYEEVLPDDHVYIADLLMVLADCQEALGDAVAAEESMRRSVAIYEHAFGDRHRRFANGLVELGGLLGRQGRGTEAAELQERALAIRETMPEPNRPELAESLLAVAELRRAAGRPTEAEELYRRALRIWEDYPRGEYTSRIPGAYAAFLRERGREAEAAELEARAAARTAEGAD